MPLLGPDPSRLTKDIIKNELNQRGIQCNEEKTKLELVTMLRTNMQYENLNKIEEAWQVTSTSWTLKEMQEYGKCRGCKHMTARIIELLKSFFHTGNIDKSEWYTAKDMLDTLEKKAEVGELEISEVPKLKTIENWIGRYARQYKKELAEKAQNLFSGVSH
ncbi:hypothetical protein C2G38_2028718 [Gigaspora rosea]|uniref:Uncharacterized protein n=1 Tax=Gigaspora rosea TaxID=44941 RepID=A0A397W297_9GLOM|nr:hypothetical protein C2G38_2028718 [Gigaspora rosea]